MTTLRDRAEAALKAKDMGTPGRREANMHRGKREAVAMLHWFASVFEVEYKAITVTSLEFSKDGNLQWPIVIRVDGLLFDIRKGMAWLRQSGSNKTVPVNSLHELGRALR